MKKSTIIAALTLVMLPASFQQAFSKNDKNLKDIKNEYVIIKPDFNGDILKNSLSEDDMTTVEVDYIVGENGKAYITYISAGSDNAKSEVVKFIESASYNFNIVPGKIYSMKLTLSK